PTLTRFTSKLYKIFKDHLITHNTGWKKKTKQNQERLATQMDNENYYKVIFYLFSMWGFFCFTMKPLLVSKLASSRRKHS
uniref:Uncharacterized protein n=1 Tax=Canis lupus familiaris TaxID=9615 RepID=A0A8C0RU07_CANLF